MKNCPHIKRYEKSSSHIVQNLGLVINEICCEKCGERVGEAWRTHGNVNFIGLEPNVDTQKSE